MTKFKFAFLILVSCFVIINNVSAQEKDKLELDLTSISPGESATLLPKGNRDFRFVLLKNAFPTKEYKIQIETTIKLLEPLELKRSEFLGGPDSALICKEFNEVYQYLNELTDQDILKDSKPKLSEKDISLRIDSLKTFLKITTCNIKELKKRADSLIQCFYRSYNLPIKVGTGEIVTIHVTCDDKLWTWTLEGNEPGKWVTTYGFGFTFKALEGATYYTKQVPDTSVFQILKTSDPEPLDLNYIPAIFFSFIPSQRFNKCLSQSLTAGLGFDLTSPVVFLGYSLLFWHNIGLSAGLAFQQQQRLKSQYKENEIIGSELDKDQLHDDVYRPNLFISVNFRFGDNPFKSNKPDTKE